MLPQNPYIAGNPVGDTPAFIGRADILREVVRMLRRPQDNALVLYGQRRIGKTSVLLELAARLPESGPFYPVYFDLQDKAAWALERVLAQLSQKITDALKQGIAPFTPPQNTLSFCGPPEKIFNTWPWNMNPVN